MFLKIRKIWENYIASPLNRWLYLVYVLIIFVIFKFTDNNTFSNIANMCEFVGLSIALHEIFIVSKGINKIRKNVINSNSLLVVTEMQGKFEIIYTHIKRKDFSTARIYLHFIDQNYSQLLDDVTQSNSTNSEINKTIAEIKHILRKWLTPPKGGFAEKNIKSDIKTISDFNEILTKTKNNLNNN